MSPETLVTILCGLAIAVGVAGTIIPVLPGSILIGASLLAWAVWGGAGTAGWVVFAVGMLFVVAGMAASAVLTGRKLRQHAIPGRSIMAGLAGSGGGHVRHSGGGPVCWFRRRAAGQRSPADP